jgi:ABC-2 type transport system permease protein
MDLAATPEASSPKMPPVRPARSFARAIGDLAGGWNSRQLWVYLGWQDIKQRYRRSLLGPLWISISMGVIALAMGILYAALFDQEIHYFLPYLATGLLIWNFINGCILEGSEVFVANEGLIKFLPAPLSLHVFRVVWRQTLFFLHNLVVWVVLMLIFPRPLGWSVLLAIPAFALLVVNGVWITIATGVLATRFRDIPPIIASVAQLAFFMTPIVWDYESLRKSSNPAVAERAQLAELNPVMHFVEILRRPLIGEPTLWRHWYVVGLITVLGWAAALLVLRNYRSRVAYWV